MNDNQIEVEVARCLEHCRKSAAPMICVAEYVLRLRDDHGWEPKQADEVGRRVLRMLKTVETKPGDSGVLS